jgi:hypothetical protein
MERKHLGGLGRVSVQHLHAKVIVCHLNKPNVRIALSISSLAHHLCKGAMNETDEVRDGIREMTDHPSPPGAGAPAGKGKELTPAAKRALAEAEARRQAAEANAKPPPKEFQGPKGPEPTRYGDWETKGIASDF